MAKLFNKNNFFWHDISSGTCSVYLYFNAKYQKPSVKALVQDDFPVYALSKQKQNKKTGKNG